MQRTRFDFDVIAGPVPPRAPSKSESRPDAGNAAPRAADEEERATHTNPPASASSHFSHSAT
jgi:hypothetical protein